MFIHRRWFGGRSVNRNEKAPPGFPRGALKHRRFEINPDKTYTRQFGAEQDVPAEFP